MSALRVPGPDGRVVLVIIDDGAVGRIHGAVGHTRQMGQYDLPSTPPAMPTPPSRLAQQAEYRDAKRRTR